MPQSFKSYIECTFQVFLLRVFSIASAACFALSTQQLGSTRYADRYLVQLMNSLDFKSLLSFNSLANTIGFTKQKTTPRGVVLGLSLA